MIKAEGHRELGLQGSERALSRRCRGLKIGLWVPVSVGRDQDGLEPGQQSRHISEKLPAHSLPLPVLVTGLGCAGSSS